MKALIDALMCVYPKSRTIYGWEPKPPVPAPAGNGILMQFIKRDKYKLVHIPVMGIIISGQQINDLIHDALNPIYDLSDMD